MIQGELFVEFLSKTTPSCGLKIMWFVVFGGWSLLGGNIWAKLLEIGMTSDDFWNMSDIYKSCCFFEFLVGCPWIHHDSSQKKSQHEWCFLNGSLRPTSNIWQLKSPIFSRRYILKRSIFYCVGRVSFREAERTCVLVGTCEVFWCKCGLENKTLVRPNSL